MSNPSKSVEELPQLPAGEDVPSTSRQDRAVTRLEKNSPLPAMSDGPALRIRRELSDILQNPPPNCSAEMYKEDLFHWRATVLGPSGTVYEGGTFKLDIQFMAAYPFRPPLIRFLTRIYHCNVESRGYICLDVLNERWSPVMNIAKVLLSIWVLMGECNPDDPLIVGIAAQYKNNRNEHDKVARNWTKRYAMAKSGAKPKSKLESEKKEKREKEQEQQPSKLEQQSEVEQQQQQPEMEKEQQSEQNEQPTTATSSSIAINITDSRSSQL